MRPGLMLPLRCGCLLLVEDREPALSQVYICSPSTGRRRDRKVAQD